MKSNKEFVFICDKGWKEGWNDRGGVSYLLKSYLEEFTSKDNVKLIVKINMSYGTNINKFIEELKIENKDLPKLEFNTEILKYEDLVKLYHMGDVYVCPSRAEGFGLGMIQALACGIPVITTDFGGQTDFIPNDEEVGYHIGGELEEIKFDVMYEGCSWLTPNISELKEVMRNAYNNREMFGKEETKTKCLDIAKQYSWENAAKIAYNYLLE